MQKNNLAVALLVICAVLIFLNIQSCGTGLRQKKAREKEMAVRLDAEEKLVKLAQEKQAVEDKLAQKEQELADEKAAHQVTKKALVQEQLVNQGLKEELARSGMNAGDKSKRTKK